MHWPDWWSWELELSAHVLKRMLDRGFNEVDLRTMITNSTHLEPDVLEGRWMLRAQHMRRHWRVIVEPDPAVEMILVVTAYPVEA